MKNLKLRETVYADVLKVVFEGKYDHTEASNFSRNEFPNHFVNMGTVGSGFFMITIEEKPKPIKTTLQFKTSREGHPISFYKGVGDRKARPVFFHKSMTEEIETINRENCPIHFSCEIKKQRGSDVYVAHKACELLPDVVYDEKNHFILNVPWLNITESKFNIHKSEAIKKEIRSLYTTQEYRTKMLNYVDTKSEAYFKTKEFDITCKHTLADIAIIRK